MAVVYWKLSSFNLLHLIVISYLKTLSRGNFTNSTQFLLTQLVIIFLLSIRIRLLLMRKAWKFENVKKKNKKQKNKNKKNTKRNCGIYQVTFILLNYHLNLKFFFLPRSKDCRNFKSNLMIDYLLSKSKIQLLFCQWHLFHNNTKNNTTKSVKQSLLNIQYN